jgi:hypothetical protein
MRSALSTCERPSGAERQVDRAEPVRLEDGLFPSDDLTIEEAGM